MSNIIRRSLIQRIIDTFFFPIRALFVPEEGSFNLTSLRDERMEKVANYISGRVLDIGCGPGNLFIKKWASNDSLGIDVFNYEGVEVVHMDMTALPFDDASFDTITLIAVGGHIPQHLRIKEFIEFARVLKPGGKIVMTEGEPITQTIGHTWRRFSFALIGKKDMDTERGMEEDEQYCMPYKEILEYLNKSPLILIKREKFMWGLNNVYVAKKQSEKLGDK